MHPRFSEIASVADPLTLSKPDFPLRSLRFFAPFAFRTGIARTFQSLK